jgi:hypothetical protein
VKDESERVARNEEAVEFSFDKVIHSLPLEAKESILKGMQSETRRCCFRSSETLVVSLVNIDPNQKVDYLLQNFPDLLPLEAAILAGTLNAMANQESLTEALITIVGK